MAGPGYKATPFFTTQNVFKLTKTIKLIIRDQYRYLVAMAPHSLIGLLQHSLRICGGYFCWIGLCKSQEILNSDLANVDSKSIVLTLGFEPTT